MKQKAYGTTDSPEMDLVAQMDEWGIYSSNVLESPWYIIIHDCLGKKKYLYHRVYGGICPECRERPPIDVVTAHGLLSMNGKYADLGPMKPVKVDPFDPQNVPPWYKRK